MITLFSLNFNPYIEKIQNKYDDCISKLQLHKLTCSCGHSACLKVHAYYFRTIKTSFGPIRIRICRVRCSECGKTHALLPAFIVPYSQISLNDQVEIVRQSEEENPDFSDVMEHCPSIDENNIKTILRNYIRYWKQRLLSSAIPLMPLDALITGCFWHHRYQFMQIKKTVNVLFAPTT